MKRIVAVMVAMVLMFSAATVSAESTSRREAVKTVQDYTLRILEFMHNVYTFAPDRFTDGLIMATYHYLTLFWESTYLVIIEYNNEFGNDPLPNNLKELESLTLTLHDGLRESYAGWVKGEVSRDELLTYLMLQVGTAIEKDE